MKLTPMTPKIVRCLVLLSAASITSAAVPIPELTVRPGIVAATPDQQIALLQKQVQSLQAQMAALQAVVQITPTNVIGQEPNVTIAADVVTLRASRNLMMQSGSNTDIRANGALHLRSDADTRIRAAGPLNMDGATVRFNGGTKSLATVGSNVQTVVPVGTTGLTVPVTGQIVNGSPSVFAN